MNSLQFFNRDDKYADLFETVLNDQYDSNSDATKVESVEKSIISAINTRLDHASTHCQGLNLLCKFAPKISKDNLVKYFPHWISKVTDILTNARTNSEEFTLVCKAIRALVVSCKQVPELDKKVSIYSIKQLVGIIVERYYKDKNGSLLNLLTVLLYYYPESCARFQLLFSKIISSCIDEDNPQLVYCGAKCYSLLARAVERSFSHASKDKPVILADNSNASCHIAHQINLCNNLQAIIDELFQDLVTASSELPFEEQSSKYINSLQLPEISRIDILEYYVSIHNRFFNICTYLSTLLKAGGNGGKKYVFPNVILQTLCNGLAITPKHIETNNDENRKDILLLLIPKMYTGLLNVLEALITSYQVELLPFALCIQRIILQNLEWSQNSSLESFRNVRIHTYKILSIWLRQTGSLSGFQLIADDFLLYILKDLTPPNKEVLILTAKTSKNTGKVKQKTGIVKEIQDPNDSSPIIDSKDLNMCLQVLETLQTIIANVNTYLKQTFYESVRNTVVLLLYEQYVKKNSSSINKMTAEYRLKLLKTLRILQVYAHSSIPSPTCYAIQIFGIVISQEKNSKIVNEASLGLAELRHIVYPSAPTLMFPSRISSLAFNHKDTIEDDEESIDLAIQSRVDNDMVISETTNLIINVQDNKANEKLEKEKVEESINIKLPTIDKSVNKACVPIQSSSAIAPIDKSPESFKRSRIEEIDLTETSNETNNKTPDCIDLVEPSKRSRIEEENVQNEIPILNVDSDNDSNDNSETKTLKENICSESSVSAVNGSVTKNNENDVQIDDEEMILAFCDLPSQAGLT